MKKFLLLLLLIFIGCSKVEFKDLELDIKNSTYYSKTTNQPYSGKVFSFYDNGNIRENGFLKNGKLEGIYKYYYSTGQVFEYIVYKNGDPINFVRYYEDGDVKSEGFFKNSELHGIHKSFHESNELKTESNYTDGKLDGTYKEFYSINDNNNYPTLNSIKGLKLLGNYKNDKKDGLFISYDFDGNILTEINYKNDKINGEFKTYYSSGSYRRKLQSNFNYKDGIRDGNFISYIDGIKGTYKNDKLVNTEKLVEEEIYSHLSIKSGPPCDREYIRKKVKTFVLPLLKEEYKERLIYLEVTSSDQYGWFYTYTITKKDGTGNITKDGHYPC